MLSSFPSPSELQGAIQGTMLYLSLYAFVFIPFQSFSKFYLLAKKRKESKDKKVSLRETKYYNSRDKLALCGDRTVGNFMEQALAFLPLYWIHALFVDPSLSLSIALAYTFSRVLYPIFFYYYPPLVLLSTVPGYSICCYLWVQVMTKAVLTWFVKAHPDHRVPLLSH